MLYLNTLQVTKENYICDQDEWAFLVKKGEPEGSINFPNYSKLT